MTTNTKTPSVAISASTTSASGALRPGTLYVRVVNPTTALCYVTTGAGSATAVNTNPAVGAYSTAIFQKPAEHDTVAVLLSTGTGTIAVNSTDSLEAK